jgi:hypothetical protein
MILSFLEQDFLGVPELLSHGVGHIPALAQQIAQVLHADPKRFRC